MNNKRRKFLGYIYGLLAGLSMLPFAAYANVEGDTITLGAAVSLTGKYSTNGKHTKNGYDLGVKKNIKLLLNIMMMSLPRGAVPSSQSASSARIRYSSCLVRMAPE